VKSTDAPHALESALAARAETDYQQRRMQLTARLDRRLYAANDPARAIGSAARSMRARCKAARNAVSEALESQRGTVATATELGTLFDRLVSRESASCINAVATVAGRWDDPTATMSTAEAAIVHAHERGRTDALKHLAGAADESRQRLRPLPARLVRNGLNALIGGGLLWRGGLWVSENWPHIAAHFHH
jgi:hypothetical protein